MCSVNDDVAEFEDGAELIMAFVMLHLT